MSRSKGARTAGFEVKVAAVRLVRSGMRQREVAEAFRVDASTISRWWSLAKRGGANALARRPVTGRPRRLSPAQLRTLRTAIREGPSAHGFPGRRWTARTAARWIHQKFGIEYHPGHVSRILRSLGGR